MTILAASAVPMLVQAAAGTRMDAPFDDLRPMLGRGHRVERALGVRIRKR